ncbi:MAG: methyltransferase [Pseudomonadota bacterium]|nr:methyltransferase [Pseudomonadota bacterium]
MHFQEQIRREIVPLLFFGTVITIKVYFLVDALFIEANYRKILQAIHLLNQYHDEVVRDWLIKILSYTVYNIVAILFDALVFMSYLIRNEAREKAKGFWETVFPLFTILLPVVVFTLWSIPSIRESAPRFDPAYAETLFISGVILGLIGATLSIIALWSLKHSFSLMAEVRELVTSGMYSRIRHPLYMSELIHMTGIALLADTPVALWLLLIGLGIQIARAKIEEGKLQGVLPEYAAYKRQTGFLWPKVL